MVKNESIEGFLGRLSSGSPTPGGGGAGALSGAIGCALGRMVAHLTIGRKKYAEAEERMIRSDEKLAILEETFLQLADRDEEAFQHFMDAMKRPKETEEEKTARKEAMSIALKDATEVPLAVMETVLEAFPEVHSLAISGNKNAVSDAGAAANMLLSALELENYPAEYDPYNPPDAAQRVSSEPSRDLILTLRAEGRETTVSCRGICLGDVSGGYDERANAFLAVCDRLTDLLTQTPEWQALPDYEFLYE